MYQHTFPVRRIVRLVAAIGTILALTLAGGAPSDNTNNVMRLPPSSGR